MPLDVAVASKTLTATLHYLMRGDEKPARYRTEPPAGVPRWNGIDDPHEVTIEDVRRREAEFTAGPQRLRARQGADIRRRFL